MSIPGFLDGFQTLLVKNRVKYVHMLREDKNLNQTPDKPPQNPHQKMIKNLS